MQRQPRPPLAGAGRRLLEAASRQQGMADIMVLVSLAALALGACAGLVLRLAPGEWWIKGLAAAAVLAAGAGAMFWLTKPERPRPRR